MGSMNLRRVFAARSNTCYVPPPTLHFQKYFWKSAKEKEADNAREMAKEETESIKQRLTHAKEGTKNAIDMATNIAKATTKMTKDVTQEVYKTADTVTDKVTQSAQGVFAPVWDKATKNVEHKVAEKIQEEKAEEPQDNTSKSK